MQYFLAKTEPDTYSIDDLAKEKTTTWNGVRNAQAVIALKAMKRGDKVLIYHSGGESCIVGLARVSGNSKPDPKDPKSWLVDFSFIKKFKKSILLKDIKATKKFANLALVKQSRLSTMAMPSNFINWLKTQGVTGL